MRNDERITRGRLASGYATRWQCWLLAVLIAPFTTSGCPTRADGPPTPPTSTTVPYTPLAGGGQPLVQVTLDDSTPALFLLDTGSNACVLTRDLARRLGLAVTSAQVNGHPYLVNGKAYQATVVPHLQVGQFRLASVSMIVSDALSFPTAAQPIDGILGTNALKSFPLLLDPAQRRVTLYLPAPLSEEQVHTAGFTGAALPLTATPGRTLLSAPVRLTSGARSGEEDLLVDTGASITSISARVAHDLRLKPTGQAHQARGLGDTVDIVTATVPRLEVGDTALADVPVVYLAQSSKSPTVTPPDSLGMEVLGRFRVLLDFPAGKLYLQALPDPPASVPASPTMPPK